MYITVSKCTRIYIVHSFFFHIVLSFFSVNSNWSVRAEIHENEKTSTKKKLNDILQNTEMRTMAHNLRMNRHFS